jgi:hypothetical protein
MRAFFKAKNHLKVEGRRVVRRFWPTADIAPPDSITSSARASSDGGTMNPSKARFRGQRLRDLTRRPLASVKEQLELASQEALKCLS